MNKKGLIKAIANDTEVDEETVGKVLDSVEQTILEQLVQGEEIHWGSFIRMWTTLKRPTLSTGAMIYKDTEKAKFRYRAPNCTFASMITRPMKENVFNIVDESCQ